MENIVYILHSQKLNRYYIGFTQDLDVRMKFHRNPEPRKFTSKAGDWDIFLTIECNSKKQGLAIERHIKRMKSKKYIENLKTYPEIIARLKVRYKE